MHYRGAFHLCLKQNPKKKRGVGRGGGKKSSGLGVFLTMLVICLYTILKPAERLQLPPSTAQTLRPLRLGEGGGFQKLVCVRVQRRNDRQGRGKPPEGGKASRVASLSLSLFFLIYVCACFSLKWSKSKAQLKTYICQS